jgi:enoyl-CoA hydratase/carnithine racemase
MTYEFIKVDREGPVTTVTLNQPEVMNALHSPAHFELHEAFEAFAQDPGQWAAIVTGVGERAFCAGNNLKYQATEDEPELPPTGFAGLANRFDLTKPVIAAVNGVAVGGGFELALSCDLIIASERATFALPEPKVGLAALAGGLHRLPRAVGTKRAMTMILTARAVTAAEGKQLGFVSEVVAPADLMATALRCAEEICALSPMSVRASKETVYRGLDEPTLAGALANQQHYPAVQALFRSSDATEGAMAFREKRAPRWQAD